MNTRKSFQASIVLIAAVMMVGTAGYSLIEGWSILDSLYMTVITITTIGFREVHDMSDAGRFFTVVLVFFSVGAVFYALNNAARLIIEGEIKDLFGRKKLQKTLSRLEDHYIICGHGRMGRIIARELEVIIVAIKDGKGRLRMNPGHDTVISTGETPIVIGEEEKLRKLEAMAVASPVRGLAI